MTRRVDKCMKCTYYDIITVRNMVAIPTYKRNSENIFPLYNHLNLLTRNEDKRFFNCKTS